MDAAEFQNNVTNLLPTLPNKARRVAEYLLTNMRGAAFKSIGEAAQDLNVSKAQLVRVSRILGFSGYTELKECLQTAILEQVNPAAMLARAADDKDKLPDSIHLMEHANIDDSWTQLDHTKIPKFCSLLSEASYTCCVGWGISSLVVELAYMRMTVLGMKVSLAKRGSMSLIEQTRPLAEGCVGLVCELPSYAIDVTESIEKAKNRGAKIITITDSPAAPICRFADLSFYVSASSPTFGSSLIGPMFLMHILTSALALHMGDEARSALDEQTQYLHDERVFHPIFGLKY